MVVFWGLVAWGALLLLRGRDQTAPADRRPGPKEILDSNVWPGARSTQSSTGSGLQPWAGAQTGPARPFLGELAACSVGPGDGDASTSTSPGRRVQRPVGSRAARVGTQGIGLSFISLSHGAGILSAPARRRCVFLCQVTCNATDRSRGQRPRDPPADGVLISGLGSRPSGVEPWLDRGALPAGGRDAPAAPQWWSPEKEAKITFIALFSRPGLMVCTTGPLKSDSSGPNHAGR